MALVNVLQNGGLMVQLLKSVETGRCFVEMRFNTPGTSSTVGFTYVDISDTTSVSKNDRSRPTQQPAGQL